MSTDLLKAARAEEQRLLKELEATPLFRRLEAVRAVLRAYQDLPNAAQSHGHALRPTKSQSARAGSLTSQVVAIAQDHLRQQQRRAQSLEILRVVNGLGIEVPGKKPSTIIASILSHSELFDNVRGQGYGLTEWQSESAQQPGETRESASGYDVDAPENDGEPEVELGDSGFPQTGDLDFNPNSATDSNGATNADRSWPQFGS